MNWRYKDLVHVMSYMGFSFEETRAYVKVKFSLTLSRVQFDKILKEKIQANSEAHKYFYSNQKVDIQFLIIYSQTIGRTINTERDGLRQEINEKPIPILHNKIVHKPVFGNETVNTSDPKEIKKVILEESIRIGSADASLMAENIIFRLML